MVCLGIPEKTVHDLALVFTNKVSVPCLDLSEILFSEYIIPVKYLFRLLSSRYCSFHFFQI